MKIKEFVHELTRAVDNEVIKNSISVGVLSGIGFVYQELISIKNDTEKIKRLIELGEEAVSEAEIQEINSGCDEG